MVRLVKRYGGGSRKLYDTEESRYVSLDEVAAWVREGQEVQVFDSGTGEDVTRQVLAQIILEGERQGKSLLSADLFHDVIRRGEAALQARVQQLADANRADGDCCSSFCALENAPIPAITAATMTSTQITWPALAEASGYDVVAGDLGMLRQSGGEFSGSALLCLADDDPATSVDHTSDGSDPRGGGLLVLVRGVKCTGSGIFDDLGPRLAQSRDGELAASGLPCTTP